MLVASHPEKTPTYRLGGLVLFGAVIVIATALAFEFIGGYEPCPLCLQQRYTYYAAIPLLFAALVLIGAERPRLAALLFVLVALVFLANAGLGTYHAGAEWKYWPGPDTCSATLRPLSTGGGGLLNQLGTTRVVRCDEAAWRMLGLSFAGWNVVASLLLAAGAALAAGRAVRHR